MQYINCPLTLKSFAIASANFLNLSLLSLVGLPSVSTIITFGLSSRSPPIAVNSLSLAIIKARSVRVCNSRCKGSWAILLSRAFLSWYLEFAKSNAKVALLWKVIKPKWSASGAGWNLLIRFSKNVMTFFRLGNLTLFDLSRTIPISSPAVQGGAVPKKKKSILLVTHYKRTFINVLTQFILGYFESPACIGRP